MNIILNLIAAFIMVLAFGVIFQAPKRSLWLLGVTGSIGWGGFLIGQELIDNIVTSAFIASLIIGICSELFARWIKLPATVFIISGILPLVPGIPAYNAMFFILQGDYLEGLEAGIDTILIAGAISFAIAITGTAARYYKKVN
ncbi:threonine/serine exporter family protein [Natroniella sulfidigena]|uniref:threonine/serine exporter family protein n=1 Tax=Natroniella sulfidigena TaxID=723921 RepID=UPI00200B3983|nr:threonine/serine exporter family protein [Natroniella sulfidigena]MCK8817431.1 threonine/serine exporter family protein [Natroniella sulfidigena]